MAAQKLSKHKIKTVNYLSAKESHRISRENRKATDAFEKRNNRKNVPEEEYLTEMRDRANVVEFDDLHTYFFTDTGIVKTIQQNIGYFIAYENLFSTWLEMGRDFDVSNVRDALSAFSRLINPTHKKVFHRILDTLQTGLSKLGDSSGTQTKSISNLIQLIDVIPMDGRQDYDVLGFIYEYLISMFAANAGKKAGEFYTPHEVSLLMSEIVADHLKDRNEIK
ncbi:MAG: hypothetical protein EOM69_05425, partial [Clostridia bacterium]|nr:hypothetical protein [Clostridia bacterium]